MSTWRPPRKVRPVRRPVVGAWDAAIGRAVGEWRAMIGDPYAVPDPVTAAVLVAAAAGLLPYVTAELRALGDGPADG